MSPGRRWLVAALATPLTVTALLAVGILLFGDFGATEGRILATTALLSGYALLALPAGFLLDRERVPALALAVLVLAAAGFALAVAGVWAVEVPGWLGKSIATVTAFAVAATQTAALVARRRDADPVSVRRLLVLATALVLVVAALATAAAWLEIEDDEVFFRTIAALAVLDVLTVALQPILGLTRRPAAPYRLRLTGSGGEEIETTIEAHDLGAATARAVRSAARSGVDVVALERLEPPRGQS